MVVWSEDPLTEFKSEPVVRRRTRRKKNIRYGGILVLSTAGLNRCWMLSVSHSCGHASTRTKAQLVAIAPVGMVTTLFRPVVVPVAAPHAGTVNESVCCT